jgi:ankyrin repeat protein
LRDYLYIPLGGNRHGTYLTLINLIFTCGSQFAYFRIWWNNYKMIKFCDIRFIFPMLYFVIAGSVWADTENTFGLKNGKALFDAKEKALPEIRITNTMDRIGLDVNISSSANHDKALDIGDISASDRAGSFFNNKKMGVKTADVTVQRLYRAIESGDLEDVKRFQIGININFQDKRGVTPLYHSIFHKQTELAPYLLRQGADVNLPDHEGLAPLHVAALENLPEMVTLLLDKGARLNATDKYGYTPLHLAIDQSSNSAADELLAAGAEVNNHLEWGHSPLHTSVALGNLKMVKRILGEGAEINSKDKLGRTPLHWAAEKGHLSVAKFLIQKGSEVNATDNEGETPMHDAAQWGKRSIVELLISCKADIHAKGSDGRAPMHIAIANGNSDITDLLKNHGALL